ncbi:hypothetical protein SLEP1_g14234 [Rubroshorea leprosula]|uniref:Uncharacterized protein n=1 Tax=Rubroshorea leprosula TaxID=152421 RepID=A0AAV5IPA7_9ROSI|nr:hypothetical protein SLEP1_g14234 [Rubroshorea leprosula]
MTLRSSKILTLRWESEFLDRTQQTPYRTHNDGLKPSRETAMEFCWDTDPFLFRSAHHWCTAPR